MPKNLPATITLDETFGGDLAQSYLKLDFGKKVSAALPMNNAQEVLMLAKKRITPIPNMPNCVLGLINQRSRVFWLIDLPQMLEMKPVERNQQQYHLAIIRSGDIPLGLIVPQVQGVIRLCIEEIQSPIGNVSPGLVPYLKGCCLKSKTAEILLILDTEAIVNSPMLQTL